MDKTIIFITHDLDEALRLGDRIAILKDGELVQQGSPDEILLHPADEYVEAFVKDVNRARALTVETLMQPPSYCVRAETIEDALSEMKRVKRDYAYHETNAGYQGVITQQGLLNAAKLTHLSDWRDDIYEEVPIISPHLAIEQVLTEVMSCEYSLPVIDKHGNLKGELNRQVIAELFSDQRSTKRGTSRSSFNNVS